MRLFKYIIFLLPVLIIAVIFSSCNDEDAAGEPVVHYVRVTNPAKSDSLLNSAFLGGLVAIMGENLGGVKEIWFNDQKALLIPTYITNRSILVDLPSATPNEVTDQMRLVFAGGKEILHSFKVSVPAPVLTAMKSEYVLPGQTAIVKGDYFFEPIKVMFSNGEEIELESLTRSEFTFVMPDDAPAGPITVKTNFGTTESPFHLNDARNIIWDATPGPGWWWGGDFLVSPTAEGAMPINGHYIRRIGVFTGSWAETFGGPPSAIGDISKNIPDEAILDPSKYLLKFEVNTFKPYTEPLLRIMLGNVGGEGADPNWRAESYAWSADYDTKGEWETVVIPFNEVIKNMNIKVRPQGYGIKFWFWSPDECDCSLDADIAFDNVRVVPAK